MQGSPSKKRFPFVILTLFLLVGMMLLFHNLSNSNLYFCEDNVVPVRTHEISRFTNFLHHDNKLSSNLTVGLDMDREFHEHSLARKFDFDISGNDVIVFLHIQKTGGTTFGKHLVSNLEVYPPCACVKGRRRCPCYRAGSSKQVWQFSRFSTGWICGLHADWTELKSCVPEALDKREGRFVKRRYYYISLLRHPVDRYISEWKHVCRGATWKASRHMCDGHLPYPGELPPCFDGEDWEGVGLDDFLHCESNLAANRQVRMLADLSLVGCYNKSKMSQEERDATMLQSAKTNLRRFAYFGLTEYQRESQYMFEQTFSLNFKYPFTQYNDSFAKTVSLSEELRKEVIEKNSLDIQLYEFAKDLFFQRYEYMKQHEDFMPNGEG